MIESVNDLLQQAVEQSPDFKALHYRSDSVSYLQLSIDIDRFACHLIDLGINRYDRVAVFAEKRIETVVSIFGAARAGGIFVPVNPLLKPRQVEHILLDCNVRFLVTTSAHVAVLRETLATCEDLEHIIVFDEPQDTDGSIVQSLSTWQQFESDGKTVILPKDSKFRRSSNIVHVWKYRQRKRCYPLARKFDYWRKKCRGVPEQL